MTRTYSIVTGLLAAFVAGWTSATLLPHRAANAQAPALPPIFVEGARLLSPTGPVEVKELMGEWIRIKSLHPLAQSDGDQWLYVPSLSGTWLVNTKSAEEQ